MATSDIIEPSRFVEANHLSTSSVLSFASQCSCMDIFRQSSFPSRGMGLDVRKNSPNTAVKKVLLNI